MPVMLLVGLAVIIMAVFSQGGKNEPYSGNANPVISKSLPIIKHFECGDVFRADAYYCPAGHLTIGYGHLVKPGEPHHITEPEALALLKQELSLDYLPDTLAALENVGLYPRTLTTAQIAAVLSAVYNEGATIIYDGTWVKKWLAGNAKASEQWFYKWNKHEDPSTGKLIISKGLVRRRFSEWMLFTTGTWMQYPPGYAEYYEAHR